ncbi:hypothetical protein ACL02U_15275 [Streptomyces sp. MS06]|uniref:hypothetical protein n=1 Tax=Streptomyces sp. MS06 TaxID=3385974 RepID=UPI0039A387C8
MNNWREDAQPEWPEAASATRNTPAAGGDTRPFGENGPGARHERPEDGRADAGDFPGTGARRPGTPEHEDPAHEDPAHEDPDTDAAEFLSRAARARLRAAGDDVPAEPPHTPAGEDTARPAPSWTARAPFDPSDADPTDVLPRSGGADAGSPRSAFGTPAKDDGAAGAPPATRPTRAFPQPADASSALRDPWAESGGAEHTHDPHEVTVQLDAVQLGPGGLRSAAGAPAGGHDAADGPVFVDESGRRSKRFRRLGMVIGLACAVYAVVIVVTVLSGNSSAPWVPVPDQPEQQPAGQVDPSPVPEQSTGPSGSPSASPSATPSSGGAAAPSPTTAPSGTAPAASTQPGTSADPSPTATGASPGTGGSGTGASTAPASPTTAPSASTPADPGPSPSTSTGPTADPSASSGTSGGTAGGSGTVSGTDTQAEGPSDPAPIAEGPAVEAGATADSPSVPVVSHSPEYVL